MINISSDLYKASWTELIFKNRNKAYGAYQLRAESASITARSLMIVVPAFILLFSGPALYRKIFPQQIEQGVMTTPVEIITVPPALSKPPEQKKEFPEAEPVREKLKTVKLPSGITVLERPELDEAPPTIKDVENAVTGQVTQDGEATHESVTPVAGSGTGTGVPPAEDNTVYSTEVIEHYPEFEGGMGAWTKFIQRNLRYPDLAQERDIQGKVFISFVVEKDGSISNVSVIRGIGGGCDEEAVRVIKKSPRWKPGMQHNIPVRVRYNMPLSFLLSQ
ncbi:MAG: TonB family protein [Pedobacter sp.]|uniref:energy transducer TonB n=1 Tax=Pedobacter sp. TaxID=1411316 RepID=UPI0033982CE2